MLFSFYNNYKKHSEYIPLLLLSLIFLSDNDLHKHAIQNSFQMITVVATFIIFYFVFYKTNIKILALAISAVIWIIMIYIKKNYLFNEKNYIINE